MISEAESQAYRERLQELLARIQGDRSQLKEEALSPTGGEASGGLSDLPVHPADLASHNFEEDVTLGLLENEDQIVGEIDAALDRLNKGTFGRCGACQQEIPQARLQALPYARYCIACTRTRQGEATS